MALNQNNPVQGHSGLETNVSYRHVTNNHKKFETTCSFRCKKFALAFEFLTFIFSCYNCCSR